MNDNALFVLEALLILGLPYAVWHVGRFRAVVPCAVVQIAFGLLIGPSVLGHVSPSLHAWLFSPSNLSKISGIASFSVLMFAFITGLHLDFGRCAKEGAAFTLVGASSVVAPLVLGTAVGWWMFDAGSHDADGGADRWRFAFAVGIALSVTALPVLGAILREMNLFSEPLGQWTLGLAAINDAALWILVSILFIGTGEEGALSPAVRSALIVAYLVSMFAVLRPALNRAFAKADDRLGDAAVVGLSALALGSALLSELIGLHQVLGAFAAGAIMPERLRRPLLERMEVGVAVLLTPFFFVNAGLHAAVDMSSAAFLQTVAVATAAAVLGKLVGAGVPAALVRKSWREGLAIGALMQTKGLMELVVLTIFLEAGLITDGVFSALVSMAIVTTGVAMPLARIALNCDFRPVGRRERKRDATLAGGANLSSN